MADTTTIALLGTGLMGAPMSRNLMKAGHALILVVCLVATSQSFLWCPGDRLLFLPASMVNQLGPQVNAEGDSGHRQREWLIRRALVCVGEHEVLQSVAKVKIAVETPTLEKGHDLGKNFGAIHYECMGYGQDQMIFHSGKFCRFNRHFAIVRTRQKAGVNRV